MSKTSVLIEVKGGQVIFVGSTTKMDVTIIDHDGEKTNVEKTEADTFSTQAIFDDFVAKASAEPGNM